MVQLRGTRQDLWPKDIPRKRAIFDTYSPVARLTTICTLIAVAASYGLIIHQMVVKTTFLNGELDEEIYMDQPEGFIVDGQEN
jgi:hypothetical protein